MLTIITSFFATGVANAAGGVCTTVSTTAVRTISVTNAADTHVFITAHAAATANAIATANNAPCFYAAAGTIIPVIFLPVRSHQRLLSTPSLLPCRSGAAVAGYRGKRRLTMRFVLLDHLASPPSLATGYDKDGYTQYGANKHY